MFDRRFLPRADLEFVVVGDTHYMLDAADVEFESRRKQTARVEAAIDRINAIEPDFVVHLGDLVQEYPGSGAYETALEEALTQLDRIKADTYTVAGNHDIGDKPDPTMPTDWVTTESLERYHDRVGPSWDAWEAGRCHFIVLNSQIMNAELDAAVAQRKWAEERVAAIDTGPAFLFCHLPPYLHAPDEPGLGHYDTIAEPARLWLCELVQESPITDVFSGHCHFGFLGRIGGAWFRVTPSVSFTRPGFAELFSSGPPPERGRNETAKLGFYLVRVVDGQVVVTMIRTGGATESGGPDRLLSQPLAEGSGSPLGVSLVYPLTDTAEIPEAFPSALRYPVENAYPTLSCLELGAGVLRLPMRDLEDGRTREYLHLLREHGATIVGTALGVPPSEWPPPGLLDDLEMRLPADWIDSGAGLSRLRGNRPSTVGLNLSEVVPRRSVPEKQHGRLRNGFSVVDLDDLEERLDGHTLDVDRVTCRIRDGTDPWPEIVSAPGADRFSHIGAIDWLVSQMNVTMSTAINRIAASMAAVATRDGSRIYLEPVRAMDRTMDPAQGLLDRRCNPTPAFTATRCLNTVLFGSERRWTASDWAAHDDIEVMTLTSEGAVRCLALPKPGAVDCSVPLQTLASGRWEAAIRLSDGVVREFAREDVSEPVAIEEPTVFLGTDQVSGDCARESR